MKFLVPNPELLLPFPPVLQPHPCSPGRDPGQVDRLEGAKVQSQGSWIQVLTLPLACYVTLGKSLYLSVPHNPYLQILPFGLLLRIK
jgi:hypothetical protein